MSGHSKWATTKHKKALVEQGIATQEEIDQVDADATAAIAEALEFARESPYPEAEDLLVDMYADPIPIS